MRRLLSQEVNRPGNYTHHIIADLWLIKAHRHTQRGAGEVVHSPACSLAMDWRHKMVFPWLSTSQWTLEGSVEKSVPAFEIDLNIFPSKETDQAGYNVTYILKLMGCLYCSWPEHGCRSIISQIFTVVVVIEGSPVYGLLPCVCLCMFVDCLLSSMYWAVLRWSHQW